MGGGATGGRKRAKSYVVASMPERFLLMHDTAPMWIEKFLRVCAPAPRATPKLTGAPGNSGADFGAPGDDSSGDENDGGAER